MKLSSANKALAYYTDINLKGIGISKELTQKSDVPITYADTSHLEKDFGYKPSTALRKGLREFARWYCSYYYKK